MNVKMKTQGVIIFVLCLAFLVGCSGTAKDVGSANSSYVERACRELTSSKSQGRLTGTEGNKYAEKYIVGEFKKIGLLPYFDDSFTHEYEHEYLDFENQMNVFTITYDDGTSYELVFAEDYMLTNPYKDLDIECLIAEGVNDGQIKDRAILVEDMQEYRNTDGEKPKAILVKESTFFRSIQNFEDNVPVIRLKDDAFDLLGSKPGKLHIVNKTPMTTISANNIIGKFKGRNSQRGIVISAHFDHVGRAGDLTFSGAFDNASGVASMLSIAKHIAEYNKESELEQNIIFCAFNGEESGRQGSMAIADRICSDYEKLVNINIDCIGKKGEETILISGYIQENEDLMDALKDYFVNQGYRCELESGGNYVSDHISFGINHVQAVNIGQEVDSIIHTPLDTIDILDFEYISAISKRISEYITEYGHIILGSLDSVDQHDIVATDGKYVDSSSYEEIYKKIHAEEEKLDFNQYMLVDIDGRSHFIHNQVGLFKDLSDAQEYFPKLEIPEQLVGYRLEELMIVIDGEHLSDSPGNIKEGTIYTAGDIHPRHIRQINLDYWGIDDEGCFMGIEYYYYDDVYELVFGHDSGLQLKIVEYGGTEYVVTEHKESGTIQYISFTVDKGKEKYIVVVRRQVATDEEYEGHMIMAPDWFDNSLEESLQFIHEHRDSIEEISIN